MGRVFLDTCIWFELLVEDNPSSFKQKKRTVSATQLFSELVKNSEEIVTIDIQLIEITQTIIKAKFKECNRNLRSEKKKMLGNIKEFRTKEAHKEYYDDAIKLSKMVIDDMKKFISRVDIYHGNIDDIILNIAKVDINDYIYYEYCARNDIKLYTFDSDFEIFHYKYLYLI